MNEELSIETRLTLYALNALDARERLALQRELDASPALQAQLRELQGLTSALALAPLPVTPSPGVKRALLERVEAPKHRANRAPSFVFDWRSLLRTLAGPALTVAALALVFGAQLTALRGEVSTLQQSLLQSQRQTGEAQEQLATLSARLASANDRMEASDRQINGLAAALADARGQLTQVQATANANSRLASDAVQRNATANAELSVLVQPELRNAALAASAAGFADARVTVFYAPQGHNALVSVSNLPPLPEDRTYQLWLIKGEARLPSVIFNTDATGSGRVLVMSNEALGSFGLAGITVEPAGGRPTPNPAGPIFLGKLNG